MGKKKDVSEKPENPLLGYDSHALLEAVDLLDDVRPVISDEGYDPPKIRTHTDPGNFQRTKLPPCTLMGGGVD